MSDTSNFSTSSCAPLSMDLMDGSVDSVVALISEVMPLTTENGMFICFADSGAMKVAWISARSRDISSISRW